MIGCFAATRKPAEVEKVVSEDLRITTPSQDQGNDDDTYVSRPSGTCSGRPPEEALTTAGQTAYSWKCINGTWHKCRMVHGREQCTSVGTPC